MAYASCPAHTFPHQSCDDCQGYQLTGLQRTYLESRRTRITAEDGPAYDIAADLEPDGLVRFRPATLTDQLDRIIAAWLFDQALDDADALADEDLAQGDLCAHQARCRRGISRFRS